ncbi:MAG: alpha/beta hydrolase family protein [Caulobacteraceae bacterium]
MRLAAALACLSVLAVGGLARAQPLPAAIAADPPADKAHPATLYAFALPTGGVKINAVLLTAAGAGAHPTVLLLHGFPGNEQNLDLAQAIRRAGWNVLTLHYRGAWGSPGAFSFAHVQEDAAAAVAWLRDPLTTAAPHIDPRRIVVIGHSMGGWAAAFTAARDPGLLATGLISAANMGAIGAAPRAMAVKIMDDNMAASAGMVTLAATPQGLADEAIGARKAYDFTVLDGGLSKHPLLLVTSDDGLAGASAALAKSLKAGGDTTITQVHIPTDHSYSDHRIALEATILTWLDTLPGAPAGG